VSNISRQHDGLIFNGQMPMDILTFEEKALCCAFCSQDISLTNNTDVKSQLTRYDTVQVVGKEAIQNDVQ
jgi:hypothetical protein